MMVKKRRITKAYFDFARRKYSSLIEGLAYKFGYPSQAEELFSLGLSELLKCLICYNNADNFVCISKGEFVQKNTSSFQTFLYGRLSGVFRHARSAETKLRLRNNAIIFGTQKSPTKNDNTISKMMVEELLDSLSLRERDVVTKIYLEGMTMREISGRGKMVASTVCRIKATALEKMRIAGNRE